MVVSGKSSDGEQGGADAEGGTRSGGDEAVSKMSVVSEAEDGEPLNKDEVKPVRLIEMRVELL